MVECSPLESGGLQDQRSLWHCPMSVMTRISTTAILSEPVPDGTASASLPMPRSSCQSVSRLSWTYLIRRSICSTSIPSGNELGTTSSRGVIHFSLEWLYLQAGGAMSDVRQRLSPELNVNVREKRDSLNGTVLLQASKRTSLAVLFEGSRYNYGESEPGTTYIDEWLSRDEGYF